MILLYFFNVIHLPIILWFGGYVELVIDIIQNINNVINQYLKICSMSDTSTNNSVLKHCNNLQLKILSMVNFKVVMIAICKLLLSVIV